MFLFQKAEDFLSIQHFRKLSPLRSHPIHYLRLVTRRTRAQACYAMCHHDDYLVTWLRDAQLRVRVPRRAHWQMSELDVDPCRLGSDSPDRHRDYYS